MQLIAVAGGRVTVAIRIRTVLGRETRSLVRTIEEKLVVFENISDETVALTGRRAYTTLWLPVRIQKSSV